MTDMREMEAQIASELTHLGEEYPPEMAMKVLELTQREIHHREHMLLLKEISSKIGSPEEEKSE